MNATEALAQRFLKSFARFLIPGLLLGLSFQVQFASAQATAPSASASSGIVNIGYGDFSAYTPPHDSIHAGDSVEEAIIGNLTPGTDASGNEYTINWQSWSWTCTTTYSSDNTNYGPSDSQASITGGQNATLFATFHSGGYYQVQFTGHVQFQTSASSATQYLDTPPYAQNFSVDGRDFDFSVTNIAINQGESNTFTSDLTSINNFTGLVLFSNFDGGDPLFAVSGAGALLTPGTAPITIGVGSSVPVGGPYMVSVRGSGKAGGTPLYHDKIVNVTVLKRGATISCPTVDTSKYRFPALTGPIITNVRQADGSMRGDTVKPKTTDVLNLTYSLATLTGYWSTDNTYKWDSPVADAALHFSFTNNWSVQADIQPLALAYTVPLTSDALTLGLADHGHTAAAVYTMNFHEEYEPTTWPEFPVGYRATAIPEPAYPAWTTYPWKAISLATPLTYPYALSATFTKVEPGFESIEAGVDIGEEPILAHFGYTYRVEDGFTQSTTLTPNPALKFGEMTWAVYEEIVTRHRGYLDHYGTHGYMGGSVWYHDKMTGIDLSLYTPYQPVGSLPSDPPAGWQPPGY